MFSKTLIPFVALSILTMSEQALGRERWLERDSKFVSLHPRRFGQEHPAVIDKLSSACSGQVCGTLAGSAISTLLGAASECAQQDQADDIIDAAAQFDNATAANMIALAVEFRQVEKNTPPDSSTNPPTNRNSVFCQTAPRNAQLNGLVQAQDPANDPNVFFDPATSSSVTLGSQANTFPFGTNGASSSNSTSSNSTSSDTVPSAIDPATATAEVVLAARAKADAAPCADSLVTVAVSSAESAVSTDASPLVTQTVSAAASDVTATDAAVTATSAAAAASNTAAASGVGNFGSCTTPQIQFGVGFDNRKETSFEPVDQTSFNHGSADNIDVITQFICNTLTNTCGADQTAKDTCTKATAAADAVTAKTGGQADAFNAAFGITTNFASVAEVDDQGNVVSGSGSGAASAAAGASAATVAAGASSTAAATAAAAAAPAASATAASSGVGNFGSCTTPQIQFGVGFDNRKETSFEPVDQTSFNHGSADNIDIISKFICDTLTNTCGADQTAKDTCTKATAAADAVTAKTGGQADAFNAAFGITTNFAAVTEVDDQGNAVAGTGSGSAAGSAVAAVATAVSAATPAAATAASSPAAATVAAASGGNLQTFTGALGGVTAPAVTDAGNGQFQVDGNSAFNSLQNALVRSCDVQHNQCSNAANSSGNQGALTVAACGDQDTQCEASAKSAASAA
ncbi:hypothetical protein DFH11DRAFT_1541287 [Phellopilus nigrolimitatus]|nr:hypothetical protein DFH11DRAFT_1541287 [Phellopilus nigrolimitatus]